MVLPEVMLFYWFNASVYYYLEGKPYLLFISLSTLVWTKETGIIYALSFSLLIFLKVLIKQNNFSVSNLMPVGGSLMIFAFFFFINTGMGGYCFLNILV